MSNIIKSTEHSSTIDIDKINSNINQLKEQEEIQKALNEYYLNLTKYKNSCYEFTLQTYANHFNVKIENILPQICQQISEQVNFQYNIFYFLNQFTFNKSHEIYWIKNIEFTFNKTNYRKVFSKAGFYAPPIEFINSFYEILNLRKENGSCWKYLHYKYENRCSSCIFDYFDLFSYFDGNILFNDNPLLNNNNGFLIRTNNWLLLYEKTYRKPVDFNNFYAKQAILPHLKQPTISQFRAIIDILRITLKQLRYESIPVEHKEQILLQLILRHLPQKYKLDNLIQKTTQRNFESSNYLDEKAKNILESRQNFFIENKDTVPINLILQLTTLTDGNIDTMDQLAKLIARINLTNGKESITGISPKLTIIMTPTVKLVKKFFDELYPEGKKDWDSIHNLINKESIIDNILHKLNGTILHVCECGNSVKHDDLKILKKLVRFMPVREQDKYVGNITYISNCHYVVLVEKQEMITDCKNCFQSFSEVIVLNSKGMLENNKSKQQDLPSIQSNNCLYPAKMNSLTTFDYNWVHTVFATYGSFLLAKEKKIRSNKQSLDLKSVVLSFLEECCILEPSTDCYADDLYSLYKGYFIKKYGVEPVKKIRLINTLKYDFHYPYCRLRHHAKDNRWGFKGISIKEGKNVEYILPTSDCKLNQRTINIAKCGKYIKTINEEIGPLIGIEL